MTEVEKSFDVRAKNLCSSSDIVKFKGTDTPEEAEMLRGTVVYIYRKDVKLPQGVYFVQDIWYNVSMKSVE